MEASLKIESISRHSRAATVTAPTNGRITYVGTPFAQWAEIKRSLGDRHMDVRDSGDPRGLLSSVALALTDLVVVGQTNALREPHEICGDIRRLGFRGPILLLTSADDVVTRILGLENGADVWAAVDADVRSAVAQIRALVRREQSANTVRSSTKLRAGKFVLDSASREVAVGEVRVDLTTLEFELLWSLVDNAGEIMSRERLADAMGYDRDALEGRAIDTVVARLRHHLGQPHAAQIRTIRGVGYMLCAHSIFEPAMFGTGEHAQ